MRFIVGVSLPTFRVIAAWAGIASGAERQDFGQNREAAVPATPPGDSALGHDGQGDGLTYSLHRKDRSKRLPYVPTSEDSTWASITDAVGARGTRFLSVALQHAEDWILRLP